MPPAGTYDFLPEAGWKLQIRCGEDRQRTARRRTMRTFSIVVLRPGTVKAALRVWLPIVATRGGDGALGGSAEMHHRAELVGTEEDPACLFSPIRPKTTKGQKPLGIPRP
jgi:hypothetical protein